MAGRSRFSQQAVGWFVRRSSFWSPKNYVGPSIRTDSDFDRDPRNLGQLGIARACVLFAAWDLAMASLVRRLMGSPLASEGAARGLLACRLLSTYVWVILTSSEFLIVYWLCERLPLLTCSSSIHRCNSQALTIKFPIPKSSFAMSAFSRFAHVTTAHPRLRSIRIWIVANEVIMSRWFSSPYGWISAISVQWKMSNLICDHNPRQNNFEKSNQRTYHFPPFKYRLANWLTII